MALLTDLFKGVKAGAQEFYKVAEVAQKTNTTQTNIANNTLKFGNALQAGLSKIAKAIEPKNPIGGAHA